MKLPQIPINIYNDQPPLSLLTLFVKDPLEFSYKQKQGRVAGHQI